MPLPAITCDVIDLGRLPREISGAPDTGAWPRSSDMSEFTDLIDRYIAVWNETDGERRRALIAHTFTDNASYLDPLMAGDGAAAIDGMIAAVQQRFPGYRFRRKGEVD